jgi:GR25 family glycosyltransferase involved in LPS biosynthesis
MNYSFRGYYINLDRSIDRLIFIEHQLRENNILSLYKRVEAIDVNNVVNNSKLTDSENACRYSHIKALKDADKNYHIHIIEDDVTFVDNHFAILENTISVLNNDWDILLTGVQMPLIKKQIDFLLKVIDSKNNLSIMDMNQILFVGAFSYVVNKNSIDKMLNTYETSDKNIPFDFILRNNICFSNNIKAKLIFPMITKHSGEFYTTMLDRPFELTYDFQYLFQKALILNSNYEKVMSEVITISQSYGIDIQNKEASLKNIYDKLFILSKKLI